MSLRLLSTPSDGTSFRQVAYRPTLTDQLRDTFDVYLAILNGVDLRVRAVRKQDTPNWRIRNACAPCLYTLENEPQLKYSLLATMDGNQSLKLVDSKFRAGTPRTDPQRLGTDLYLSPEAVDQFKDDVANSKRVR